MQDITSSLLPNISHSEYLLLSKRYFWDLTEGTLSNSICYNTHFHITFSYLILHTLRHVSAWKLNLDRTNLPFFLVVSGKATTLPTTPIRLSNLQYVASTPNTNHIANSVTGTLKDVLSQLKTELHHCHVPNMPLDTFLKHFVTLENTQCEVSLLYLFFKSKPPRLLIFFSSTPFRLWLHSNAHWFISFP